MTEVRALIPSPGHCSSRGPWQEIRGPVFTTHSPGCCCCVRHADQMPALTCAHTERHVLHGLYFRAFVTGEGLLAAGQECRSSFVRCLSHFQIHSPRLREETDPVQVSFLHTYWAEHWETSSVCMILKNAYFSFLECQKKYRQCHLCKSMKVKSRREEVTGVIWVYLKSQSLTGKSHMHYN